jgi:hypothetical protein
MMVVVNDLEASVNGLGRAGGLTGFYLKWLLSGSRSEILPDIGAVAQVQF